MNWRSAFKSEQGAYVIPYNWLSPHYFEAFNILFRLENSLRIFVYCILKNIYLDKWLTENIVICRSGLKSIQCITNNKLSRMENYAHLCAKVRNPLLYLTLSELVSIILLDINWTHFSKYFPTTKDIIKFKFDEIIAIRNSLSHFRPINNDDTDNIKLLTKQLTPIIETFISGINLVGREIPSNRDEEWVQHIRNNFASTEEKIIYNLCESEDRFWIRLSILSNLTILNSTNIDSTTITRLINVNIYRLLKNTTDLNKYMTFITEMNPQLNYQDNKLASASKIVTAVFSKECIMHNYKEICDILMKTIALYFSDANKIIADNTYQGTFTESVNLATFKQGDTLHTNTAPITEYDTDDELPEYWRGDITNFQNFISDTSSYPWMPVKITG